MENSTLIDFVRNFEHVSHVDHSTDFVIVVNLTDDYVFSDTGYRHKIFETQQDALFGSNIVNTRKVVHTELVNGKIPAKTVCPYRDGCKYAKNGTCGHLGVGHTVAYSCGTARLFKIYNRV